MLAQGDYLTDGTRLVYVLLVLPGDQVLVEDAGKRRVDDCLGEVERVHIEAAVLNDWYTPREWAERMVAA